MDQLDVALRAYSQKDPLEEALSFYTTPKYVDEAKQFEGDQSFNGKCERFVEQISTGSHGKYPSAINAWNDLSKNARKGIADTKPGDLVYFSADNSNDQNGHTGIYLGNNQFISATDTGVKPYDLDDWQQRTGQQLLGFIPRKEE